MARDNPWRKAPPELVELMGGIGRFGWATDPVGNRFELWEPAPEALRRPG